MTRAIRLTCPEGVTPPASGTRTVSRFVILEHDHPFLHWDIMLEVGAALRTWRLTAPPSPLTPVGAEPLPDHRTLYLEYEGPIGGDRGSVHRWDAGTYDGLTERDDTARFQLQGTKVHGLCSIERNESGSRELRMITD
jgi:hypothetical protein